MEEIGATGPDIRSTRIGAAAPPDGGPELVLRPWKGTDVPALVEIGRDPALLRWTSTRVADPAAAGEWVARQRARWRTGERLTFAVVLPPAGGTCERMVGHVVLKRPLHRPGSAAEIGYWTSPLARGLGVAPTAVRALTSWAFAALPALARITILHAPANTASCRVAEKCGYPLTSILPPHPPEYPTPDHLHTRTREPREPRGV